MVYTSRAQRRQQFHVAPPMQQANSAVSEYTTPEDAQKAL